MNNMELLDILSDVQGKYILQAQELRSGNRKKLRLMQRKQVFLIAAVISLLLLLVGCTVVYVLNLQNMKIGDYNATIPPCEANPSEQVISSEMISLQGYAGTPGYQSAKEWQVFLSTYDTDGTLQKKADEDADGYRVPDDYTAYVCYTQQMQDKIDEICQKYGLELLGPVTIPEDGLSVLDVLGIDTILAEGAGAATHLYPGYCYQGGTFALEGETVFAPENSPWDYPIDFQYRCVMKNAFDGVFLAVGNVDDYDQWNYTMADGTQVLLAISPEKALMIVDKADYFVTVNVLNPRVGDILRGEQSMDRAAMEGFADTFCFDFIPQKVEIPISEPTPTAGQDSPENNPVRKAFQNALRTVHDDLYWPELHDDGQIVLFESGTIEDEYFAVFDADGDGQEELLVSVSNTYTAGMREIIYGYDPQTGGLRIEADSFVAVTHYPGLLEVDGSHNHGFAGDVLWPYSILIYQEATDTYSDGIFVDAWSKEIADYDPYAEMPYPDEIDTEQDGFVYLITENDQTKILNHTDYLKWHDAIFAGKEPLTVPWQRLTAANIESLQTNQA